MAYHHIRELPCASIPIEGSGPRQWYRGPWGTHDPTSAALSELSARVSKTDHRRALDIAAWEAEAGRRPAGLRALSTCSEQNGLPPGHSGTKKRPALF